jgi:uncharacterized protein YrrD
LAVGEENVVQQSRELIGKPIVSAESGHKLGKVADLLLDDVQGRMVGIVIGGGWFGSERVLPYVDVQTVGPDAIVARSESGVLDAKQWHKRGAHAARTSTLRNKRVVTKDGREIGAVKDVYVDEKTGTLTGCEITERGLIARHAVLPQSGDITIGRDVVVIPDQAAKVGGQDSGQKP